MSISIREALPTATYRAGRVHINFPSGVDCSFPVVGNSRLSAGTEEQLANIRVTRSGLHWPDVDEDLSFDGLMRGDYGQSVNIH